MRAGLADGIAERIVRQAEIMQQALVALGLFDRIQVLTLQVLDQGQHRGITVGGFAQDGGNFGQAGQDCCAETTFAGDDLVSAYCLRVGADGDRLQYALHANRLGQALQLVIVEVHRAAGTDWRRSDQPASG